MYIYMNICKYKSLPDQEEVLLEARAHTYTVKEIALACIKRPLCRRGQVSLTAMLRMWSSILRAGLTQEISRGNGVMFVF